MKSAPTCPLRKPCGYCHKEYGRKIRPGLKPGESPFLESEKSWRASETCSNRCKHRLQGQRKRENAALKLENDRRISAAATAFLSAPLQ